MHQEDLQILVIGDMQRDDVSALLWDPMPGGSGLLQRLCERFADVVAAARAVVEHCPSACATSCIDCLQTFRNAYYHRHLDRKLAAKCLRDWGDSIALDHAIVPRQPSETPSAEAMPVNDAEARLRQLLLAAGFPDGTRGEQLRLSPALGTTTPDVVFRTPKDDPDVCIYLDGLSDQLHGNPNTAAQDLQIRSWLRSDGWEVLEIAATDLHDHDAMARHFRRLAGYLDNRELRQRIGENDAWFNAEPPPRPKLRLVTPTASERYTRCVPLVPLAVAAGAFGDPQAVPDESEWQWVEMDAARQLRQGMFVAQVTGESMTPAIPNGAYCLFAAPVTGTRQGRVVVVQLQDGTDPETGQRFTVKRYRSEKAADEDGWRHVRVVLAPDNAEYEPIVLTPEDEGSVAVVAELVEVLGDPSESGVDDFPTPPR